MYFAALLARTEDGWEASDTELDDVETLADLVELAREAAADEGETVLVFIEQEDAWFGIVRVDGEDDPRVYVSNAAAAARSSYGEILTSELLGDDDPDSELDRLTALDGTEDGEPEPAPGEDDDDASAGSSGIAPAGPLGEGRILADLGLSERGLLAVTEDALGEIADAIGASDILEAVR
ncbi:tRNA adenosine deaminase-associated protein [Streptomyces sp. NPDC055051]